MGACWVLVGCMLGADWAHVGCCVVAQLVSHTALAGLNGSQVGFKAMDAAVC